MFQILRRAEVNTDIGGFTETTDRLEEFVTIWLNTAYRVLGYSRISQGAKTGTLAEHNLEIPFKVTAQTDWK